MPKTRPGHSCDSETSRSSWPHSATLCWVLSGCYFTCSPSLSGLPDMWKFRSRSLDWCRCGAPLITHSKWLQTVISTALGAGKGLLFLDLSQKHFNLLQRLSPQRGRRLQYFSGASANSFFITFTQVSPNDTPGPCVALQYTYAVTYFTTIHISCICKYTYFAFMHVIQVSLSYVYKICSFTCAHACLLRT